MIFGSFHQGKEQKTSNIKAEKRFCGNKVDLEKIINSSSLMAELFIDGFQKFVSAKMLICSQ